MLKICVIGESCIDEYVYGTCERVCPEAAALCFNHKNSITKNPGMAGNTYQNFIALNNNVQIDLITCQSTIIKRRFVDQRYNSIVFREDIHDSSDRINLSNYHLDQYDYIVISDYNKGFLTIDDIKKISALKKINCLTFIDTKKKLYDLIGYVDFIKINSEEFKQNISDLSFITSKASLIVTEGENGATLYTNNNTKHFCTQKVLLRDVCGAGDTFLAALVTRYIQTRNIEQSIIFANLCACKVVSQFGVVTP